MKNEKVVGAATIYFCLLDCIREANKGWPMPELNAGEKEFPLKDGRTLKVDMVYINEDSEIRHRFVVDGTEIPNHLFWHHTSGFQDLLEHWDQTFLAFWDSGIIGWNQRLEVSNANLELAKLRTNGSI